MRYIPCANVHMHCHKISVSEVPSSRGPDRAAGEKYPPR